jgi:hypothetical protein
VGVGTEDGGGAVEGGEAGGPHTGLVELIEGGEAAVTVEVRVVEPGAPGDVDRRHLGDGRRLRLPAQPSFPEGAEGVDHLPREHRDPVRRRCGESDAEPRERVDGRDLHEWSRLS